jgi:N-acetylmuramoyl-L-alanine amidase
MASSGTQYCRAARGAWIWGVLVLAFVSLTGTVTAARFSTVVIDPGHGGRDKGAYWGGVRVHFNAHRNRRITGTETFYWGSTGRMIAGAIQRRLPYRVKTHNRGIRKRGLTMLLKSRCPAVLVECGFISNSRERMRCSTQWYQETAAKAIYDALMACR